MSGKPRKKIHFGLMVQGAGSHVNAWRAPDVPNDASINFQHYVQVTQKAEQHGIAFLFIADGVYINEKSIPHFLTASNR